jgi:hypothetical protein
MSLGFESVKNSTFRFTLIAALLALSGEAAAIGLGELRGKPVLGDRARFEVDLLGAGTGSLDSGCFQLKQPAGNVGLPWLKQATFSVRRGNPAVLEIRSVTPLTDPVLAVVVNVSCGHDVVREFVVFSSPPGARLADESTTLRAPAATPAKAPRRLAAAPRPAAVPSSSAPAPVSTRLPEPASLPVGTGSTMPPDDKIKDMEATVGELQKRAADLTQKIEQAAATPQTGQPAAPEVKPASPAAPAPVAVPTVPAAETKTGGSGWSLFGALFGALLAVAAWFGWRRYSQRRQESGGAPDIMVDPQRMDEHEERGGVDLQVDPVAMVTPARLAVGAAGTPPAAPATSSSRLDSVMSVSSATVDEHFEANPVMELAEIMLSFGRVKGAAQALQEYVDANPQETVKPWIRLMDVYRMAGMRHEFERIARDLNKNFNVEVQRWELPAAAADSAVDVVLDTDHAQPASRPDEGRVEGVEGMPAIMEQVLMRWNEGDVISYLNQLLRDNRGGTRIGFPLSVVSDILFLIDLKEIASKTEGEPSST